MDKEFGSIVAHADHGTIRKAVSKGLNRGTFSLINENKKLATHDWRLMGDRVEFKTIKGRWVFLPYDDLDHEYSRGVHGEFLELTGDFLAIIG